MADSCGYYTNSFPCSREAISSKDVVVVDHTASSLAPRIPLNSKRDPMPAILKRIVTMQMCLCLLTIMFSRKRPGAREAANQSAAFLDLKQ